MSLASSLPKRSLSLLVLLILLYFLFGSQLSEQASWRIHYDSPKSPVRTPEPLDAQHGPPASQAGRPPASGGQVDGAADDLSNPLALPADYRPTPEADPFCSERFGVEYLERLRDSISSHCAPNSSSSVFCFHSKMNQKEWRTDSFCIGSPAEVKEVSGRKKFSLDCHVQEEEKSPRIAGLPSYWYSTGPRWLFNNFVALEESLGVNAAPTSQRAEGDPRHVAILVKREEIVTNMWHSLMQISSLYMSLDVLRMTRDPSTRRPLLSDADIQNSQIVILDDFEDGPFIDLWRLFAPRPILRWSNLTQDDEARLSGSQVVLPLAGHSNPMWQGDWALHTCNRSATLDAFTQRVLAFHNLTTAALPTVKPSIPAGTEPPPLTLTFIDRTTKRRLASQAARLAALRARFPQLHVQVVDFAALSLGDQLAVARRTDVMLGVHGAGLTHAMFVRAGGAVVEIMPPGLDYKGFANLARMRGLGYVRADAQGLVGGTGDWHDDDVEVEGGEWLRAVGEAVREVEERRS